MDGRIFYLKEKLLKNLKYAWNTEEMAEEINLSVPHFLRLFKTETGKSPITFLRNARLKKAEKLLKTSFLQIQEIGFKIGMSTDSHFTRDFKKKYGVTPTEYRKRYWEKIQAKNQTDKK